MDYEMSDEMKRALAKLPPEKARIVVDEFRRVEEAHRAVIAEEKRKLDYLRERLRRRLWRVDAANPRSMPI